MTEEIEMLGILGSLLSHAKLLRAGGWNKALLL